MIGNDGYNKTSVAPGAKWIDSKWMDMFGDGTEERALDAMQFMLAPWDLDGNNPDPTRRRSW